MDLIFALCLMAPHPVVQAEVSGLKHGFWYYGTADERGDAPYGPNASALPDVFGQREKSPWKVHPKLLAKMRKVVTLFEAAEPKPQYCHRMIDVFAAQRPKGNEFVSKPIIFLGTRLFKYNEKRQLIPNGTPEGGYLPGTVAKLLFNGASTANDGLTKVFPVVEGLTYLESKNGPMMSQGLLRAVPPVEQGYYFTELEDQAVGPSLRKVDVWPKGLRRSGAFAYLDARYITDKESRAKGSLPPWYTESQFHVIWFSGNKFPLEKFISKRTLFDLMGMKAKLAFQKLDEEMKQRKMPEDEKKKKSEESYQARQRRSVQISLDLIERLREVFKGSLDETAIIHPDYFASISSGTAYAVASEEFPVSKGGTRKYPLSGMFVTDPDKGYRVGSPVKDYYANLSDGEVRSLQLEIQINHQVPDYRMFGATAPSGQANWFADVPGNIFHAMHYSFPWNRVAEVVGN